MFVKASFIRPLCIKYVCTREKEGNFMHDKIKGTQKRTEQKASGKREKDGSD